jgi:uncharacterized membrane protein
MKVAIWTGISVALAFILMLAALVFWDPQCGGFVYEWEFRSVQRRC